MAQDEIKKVLLTGHLGYIGSVMVGKLVAAGFEVHGLDTGYYRDLQLVPAGPEIPETIKDIRDVTAEDVAGFDAVIHLAALSNDPIGNLNDTWTEQINHEASVNLAQLAKAAGVKRFLFSSSCIMYGLSETTEVDETSPLAPQTEYARSKVKSERAISDMAGDGFSPVFLRNGTIYGLSSRMRFDTVLNNLVGAAFTTGKVSVMGDGKPWRPVIHVEDVCRSFAHVLRAPVEKIHNQAFNNGADHLNYQIMDLANFTVEAVPGCTLEVLAQPSADKRTYKASFAKFARTFPDFTFEWDARKGAQALYEAFKRIDLTSEDFQGWRFTRLKSLNQLMETGRLDPALRWRG